MDKDYDDMNLFERAEWCVKEGSAYQYSDTKECLAKIIYAEELLEAAKPLMRFLAKNHHPHMKALVTSTDCELLEGAEMVKTIEFIKD